MGSPPPLSAASACRATLPRVQPVEPDRAAHGQALLRNTTLAPGVLPESVVRSLWVAWGVAPPATDQDFWAEARKRYGLVEAPHDNGGLPLGMRREGALVALDCMLCHGGRIASTTVPGAANGGVDLESFFDDLQRLRELAPALGIPAPPRAFRSGRAHAGVGSRRVRSRLRFAGLLGDGVNTRFGPTKSTGLVAAQTQEAHLPDGAGDASSHHSMMATLVAFGVTPDQLVAREQDFLDIAHYIRSVEPPCWTLSALSAEKLTRGRKLFESTCARCHGVHEGPEASYPNLVIPLEEIGTDPMRAQRFGQAEAARLNASWFGDPPFQPTFGYSRSHLVGIWARGRTSTTVRAEPSVRSRSRPAPRRWRRWLRARGLRPSNAFGVRYDEPTEP